MAEIESNGPDRESRMEETTNTATESGQENSSVFVPIQGVHHQEGPASDERHLPVHIQSSPRLHVGTSSWTACVA